MIPSLDLAAINLAHPDELTAAMRRVLDSGCFILSGEVAQFEREHAMFCGAAERSIGTVIPYPVPPHPQRSDASLGVPSAALPIAEAQRKPALRLPARPTVSLSDADALIEAPRA